MLRWLVFLVMGLSLLVIAVAAYVLMSERTVPEKGNGSDYLVEDGASPSSVLKGNEGAEVRRDERKKRSDGSELRWRNKPGSIRISTGQRQIGEKPPAFSSRSAPRHPGGGSQRPVDPSKPLNNRDQGRSEPHVREKSTGNRSVSAARGGNAT